MRLLLVEADEMISGNLAYDLFLHGFTVTPVRTGAAALANEDLVDVVLLGLELPDIDGLEVCGKLRARCGVPIIGLSWHDTELDRVLGLNAGMDDYAAKPLDVAELLARIDAVMRRVRGPGAGTSRIPRQYVPTGNGEIRRGPLLIRPETREVRVYDRPVSLTRKEFDLLVLLASEHAMVFHRSRLMAEVWEDASALPSRTIDTHVSTLRAKLGSRSWISTVHGIGFRFGHA
jgi:DNA-binding response OmpR family regulator